MKIGAKVLFDTRNLFDPARMARKGFARYAIGRGLGYPRSAVRALDAA